ncbi:MAG: ATP-binding protein [Anaerolineae bacterium]|nr:ATP-binding protein [Anaerolineae bacterium]MBT7072076.1 ATP-binding protein [Anaerolineae bacterium]MBT7325489.1 ATP-binding protein [Anaerolineae bacterium]
MFTREYEPLKQYLHEGKVLLIYGPRRVGKTTILQNYLNGTQLKYKLDTGDNLRTQHILGSQEFKEILPYAEGYELIAIDEAQNIPNIGMALKILVDQRPDLKIIVTGSSSFELAGQVGEPLTGRKRTLTLYPLSQSELLSTHNRFELKENLEDILLYGSYPEVVMAKTRKEKVAALMEIANSYLVKDILAFDRIRNSRQLINLLKLLAFQVGSEVSLSELGTQLGMDHKSVQRYLDLLEKAFVIIRLSGFSRNLRNEITKKEKYYFMDNGIRNALIAQFNGLSQRNDIGQLWENFFFIERLKYREYNAIYANHYFWRTYSQQEIDIIEERDGRLYGYECKWSPKKKVKIPKNWQSAYPESDFHVVTPENYQDFVLP